MTDYQCRPPGLTVRPLDTPPRAPDPQRQIEVLDLGV
jgi:hypothetical protein